MMQLSGMLLANAHPAAILNAWPIKLSREETMYTLNIGTPAGPLLIALDGHLLTTIRHAITMLTNFPRITHFDFPLDQPAQKEPQTLPLDMPLA